MRTIIERFLAAGLGALAALLTLAAVPAVRAAAEEPPAAADRIFEGRAEAGYHLADSSGNRSLLFPYDPLVDGPVLGFDLLYLTPEFGSIGLESRFEDADSWRAGVGYNHGSSVHLNAEGRAFTHARNHTGRVPDVRVDQPYPAGMDVAGVDQDPDRVYRDERRDAAASLKVRIPGYPAHLVASGQIDRHEGVQQMRYFFRTCSTHLCHVDSRSRELDQVTRRGTLGFDAHLGPVDLAYSHAAQTFRDDAPDPIVSAGDIIGGLPAGSYPANVNPDLRSTGNQLTLNTNLTNRVVLSLSGSDAREKNETSDLTRHTRNAGANLSWRLSPVLAATARYSWYDQHAEDLGPAARALREARDKAHAADAALRHRHVLDPEERQNLGELTARFTPVAAFDLTARVRHRVLERRALLVNEGAGIPDEAETTRSTQAGLDGRYRLGPALALDASLGREWSHGVVYAIEETGVTRYGLGATWTPGPAFMARAFWQGFRGENDDQSAIQHAYQTRPDPAYDQKRSVSGDALTAMATYCPAAAVSLTASWSLTDNSIEQDMVFGSPKNAGFAFLSPGTDWNGRSQMADLRARWELSRRVALTAEGLWIDGLESYAPTFTQGAGLEEIGTVDFTKLLWSLEAEIRVTEATGLRLGAFWARYDDRADDAGDGTARGLLAAVTCRW